MKKLLIVLAVIGAIGYFTKPDTEDFKKYINKQMEEEYCKDKNDGLISCKGMFQKVVEPVLWTLATVNESDYVVFTKCKISIGTKESEYYGVFGTFIPASKDDILKDIKEKF